MRKDAIRVWDFIALVNPPELNGTDDVGVRG